MAAIAASALAVGLLPLLQPRIPAAPLLQPRIFTAPRIPIAPRCCDSALPVSVSVAVQLEEGATELVTLSSAEDPATIADELSVRYELTDDQAEDLREDLAAQWEDASANAPPVYVGPMCNELSNCVASIELSSVGLVLEVADSVVADGGRGLFIRCQDGTESVTLDEGTAVCGYADGSMRKEPDSDGGKSVAFALASIDSVVFFEKELRTIGEVLSLSDIDAIAGHTAEFDTSGERLVGIALDPSYDGARYFVPDGEQTLTVGSLGQMANDLAFNSDDEGADAEAYEKASEASNMLALVFRLERDAAQPNVLVPTRPISTLATSISLVNDVPMELGCRYGGRYWRNRRDAEVLRAAWEAS